jgi:transposase
MPGPRETAEIAAAIATLDRNDLIARSWTDVHLACDNYGTHKTPAIRDWLARHPRFHVHFTPTGSSWINQVERWFGYLTDQKIRRGARKSVQALEAGIRDWIEQWNENPRPFAWTKTAEEILNSLAEYLSKISGGPH